MKRNALGWMLVLVAALPAAAQDDFVQIGKDKLWNAPRPDQPDLSVQYIARTPRFEGLRPEYVNIDDPVWGTGETGPVKILNEGKQRWPNPGQLVTFTAVVRNAGTQPVEKFHWVWLLDGKEVERGVHRASVAPDETVEFEYRWSWRKGPHSIAFQVDAPNIIHEISEENNWVIDRTDALSFAFFVEESTREYFKTVRNGLGSYDWADWAQFQVRQMNKEFRDTIYPSTPNGIEERVRLDKVYIIPDGWGHDQGMHTPGVRVPVDLENPQFYNANDPPDDIQTLEVFNNVNGGVDGVWGFTVGLVKPDPNKGGKNFYSAVPRWLTSSEWPLHHELGHQLGRADHYLIWSAPENPAIPGHGWVREASYRDGMMYHGNYSHDGNIGQNRKRWDSTYRFFSEHAARSFNRDKGERRGLFGEYLFDVPEKNTFTFLDPDNQPLSGAKVEVFVGKGRGYTGATMNADPNYTGTTDDRGTYKLSRNPWEHVFIWGNNGVIMFRVTPPAGQGYVGFRDIGHFNVAYWRGHELDARFVVPCEPIKPPTQ